LQFGTLTGEMTKRNQEFFAEHVMKPLRLDAGVEVAA
jgi:hypothetical protein